MTIKEAAEAYGLSRSCMSNLCRKGVIPAIKIGAKYYLDPKDVEAVLEEMKQRQTEERRRLQEKYSGDRDVFTGKRKPFQVMLNEARQKMMEAM